MTETMTETMTVAEVTVEVVLKDIKNVHLTVHPPEGRVRIAAPARTSLEVLRLFLISKLPWIRQRRQAMRAQERETPRQCIDRESHEVWGQRYLLRVVERDARPTVTLTPQELLLEVRPGTEEVGRRDVLARWYRDQVRAAAAPLVSQWMARLGVTVERVYVRRMKTRWGSCNPRAASIRLNTELAKKPIDCLEYVIVHEMAHLLEPTHDARFVALMDRFLPSWSHRRAQLEQLPVRHEEWPR